LTSTNKANPVKTGNPNSGSDTIKDRASGDNFFTELIRHIKKVPSAVEIGVLVFMTLLTNPQGSLVTYKETKKGYNVKLDGRSVTNFLATYKISVTMSDFMTGINMAIIANHDGKLANAKFRTGSAKTATGHLERLEWVRNNVVLIGAANQRLVKPWITTTSNQVMSGKKLVAAATLQNVGRVMAEKKGDELSRVVEGLNKVKKTNTAKTTTPATPAPATVPISGAENFRVAIGHLIAGSSSAAETAKQIAVQLGTAQRISDAKRLAEILPLAIELAEQIAADKNKISTKR